MTFYLAHPPMHIHVQQACFTNRDPIAITSPSASFNLDTNTEFTLY